MKLIYSGNIKSLSSLVNRVNNEKRLRFFLTNEITYAQLTNEKIEVSGLFCKGIGHLINQEDSVTMELKVRLKRQFVFPGIFVLVLLSGFIWSENVIINGDSTPTFLEKIGFSSVGVITFIVIPGFILRRLKVDFKKKVANLIK